MKRRVLTGLIALVGLGLWTPVAGAQTSPSPLTRFSFEDRVGTTGHTLVVDGKPLGPYKDLLVEAYSTSGTAAAFAVVKRDKIYVVAQGKEWGPVPSGFEIDRLQISDDGRVWILTASFATTTEIATNQTLLLVNGKSYGPYLELTSVEYAETGGTWIAAVRTAAEEADVLLTGKAQGPFYTVDHAWLTPEGKSWGYASTDSEGQQSVVTNEKSWAEVLGSNFTNLYPREPHWGYALRLGEDQERIVVDGQVYEGYLGFRGLMLTPSGRHWAFEVEKLSDAGDSRVVVINGKEYPGEALSWSRLGAQESFTWKVREGSKVQVQTLRLP